MARKRNICYGSLGVVACLTFSLGFSPILPPTRRLGRSSSVSTRFLSQQLSVRTETATETTNTDNYLGFFNKTLDFPSFEKLMTLPPGGYVESDPLTVTARQPNGEPVSYDFCVKVYPRGGGHNSQHTVGSNEKNNNKSSNSGFGMSYQVRNIFESRRADEKVGVYLQFLPRQDETVDASFAIALVGNQSRGPRFNVEWRSGMRFVALENSKLALGQANDFGAHLMHTPLLADFLGAAVQGPELKAVVQAEENSRLPIKLNVEIMVHGPPQKVSTAAASVVAANTEPENAKLSIFPNDIRGDNSELHNPEQVRVGRVVVPILRRLSERPGMFAKGAYPGVEYRIMRIIDPETEQDLFYSRTGVDYELKPMYPLVPQLERAWPVRVNEADIPKLYTPNMYNIVSAVGSLLTAVTGLLTAFVVSQAVSIFVIPSRSMDPTLQVGDVLLVDKVTPRLFGTGMRYGQVVLFQPPEDLMDIVKRSGGRITSRDLFVKRVAAETGSTFAVEPSGGVKIDGQVPKERRDLCEAEPSRLIEKFIRVSDNAPPIVIPENQVAVLGDCASVSIDSRVWGPLPKEKIVGRPIVRLWPLARVGPVQTLTTDWNE